MGIFGERAIDNCCRRSKGVVDSCYRKGMTKNFYNSLKLKREIRIVYQMDWKALFICLVWSMCYIASNQDIESVLSSLFIYKIII